MGKFCKTLFVLLFVWIAVLAISFYTSIDNIEMKDRIVYSGVFALVGVVGYYLKTDKTKTSKNNGYSRAMNSKDRALYVFEGEFGRKLI